MPNNGFDNTLKLIDLNEHKQCTLQNAFEASIEISQWLLDSKLFKGTKSYWTASSWKKQRN